MNQREFLHDLIRRTFTEWRGAPAQRSETVITPVWLSVHEVMETIRGHGTQLPGVGKDQINRITEEQVFDALRSMREVRARDLNGRTEAFSWVG